MYAFNPLIAFFVLFATLVNALPTQHMQLRRAWAHKRSSDSVLSKTGPERLGDLKILKAAVVTPQSLAKSGNTTTTTTSTTAAGSALLSAVFPVDVKTGSNGWTTVPGAPGALALSDATFKPKNIKSFLSDFYENAPDGKKAIKATYPRGSYRLGLSGHEGGLLFYASGPSTVDLTTAKEATFGYSVMFENGFKWNKGGKLPGFYGGDDDKVAIGCAGGRRSADCFSARFMWRKDGKGELYTYLPPYTDSRFAANRKQCNVAPQSDCNPTYGASVGRGAFVFEPGVWNHISERVKLNDVGKANGELEIFYNGKSAVKVTGLILRASAQGRIRGIQMETFFGGHTSDFASPKDQSAYFADLSVAITQKL